MSIQQCIVAASVFAQFFLTVAQAQDTPPTIAAVDDAIPNDAALRKSVVSISVKQELRLPSTPWKRESPQSFGGSGVVVAAGRILTNAHVVEQASEILVESQQTKLPLVAELIALDTTRDLALLEIVDADFVRLHPPIALLQGLPREGSRVTVMGFPMGGEALSTTSGVISRIEWAEIGRHDEDGMRVQVDAAINFGNSGGPAFVDGKIAGLAFSGVEKAMADNIAYLLATEEISRFLDEVAKGDIDGNTLISLSAQSLENSALRAKLGVSADIAGIVVNTVRGGPLEPWDILTKLNGYDLDNKGQILIEGDRKVSLGCAIGRFVASETVNTIPAEIIREGKPMHVELPAFAQNRGVIRRYPDGNFPYVVYGPLVFSPLHQDLVEEAGLWMVIQESPITPYLHDDRPSNGREFIAIASQLLSSPIGRGYDVDPGQTVKSVNGRIPQNFRDFVKLLRDVQGEFVVIEFNENLSDHIVFRRAEVDAVTEKIMDSNGIRHASSSDVRDLLEKN